MKRIAAFLLTVAMTVGILTVYAETNPYENVTAAQKGAALAEIIGANHFDADSETVTRRDFAAGVLGVMGFSADGSDSTCPFEDVEEEDAALLAAAVDLKLVSAGHLFRPSEGITYVEAMKMCLVAMGYERECAVRGGFPIGVITVAGQVGLNKGTKADADSVLSGSQAYTILYYMLTKELPVPVSLGERDIYETQKGVTFLSTYWNITQIEGIITENSHTTLSQGQNRTECSIVIGGSRYECDAATEAYIGCNTEAYIYTDAAGKQTVAAVFLKSTETVQLAGHEVTKLDASALTYLPEAADREVRCRLDSTYDVLYNGKAYTGSLTTAFLQQCEAVTLIDNDRDGNYEVIVLEQYVYSLISNIDYAQGVIYTNNVLGTKIDLKHFDAQYQIFDADGQSIELYHLNAGDFVQATVSEDGNYVTVYRSEAVTVGTVSAVSSGENNVTIGENTYKMSASFTKQYPTLSLSDSGSFYIGADGRIVLWERESVSSVHFGYIIATNHEGAFGSYQIKLMSDSGKIGIYDLAAKVKLNGKSEKAETVFGAIPGFLTKLVQYAVNADGKIYYLDSAEKSAYAPGSAAAEGLPQDDSLLLYDYGEGSSYRYYSSTQQLYPVVNLSGSKVFVVPTDETNAQDSDYRVTGSSIFGDDTVTVSRSLVEIFNVSFAGVPQCIVYKRNVSDTTYDASYETAVVDKLVQAVDSEGNIRYKLTFLMNEKYYSYFIDEDSVDISSLKSSGKPLSTGDIFRFQAENNEIYTMVVDFDADPSVMTKNGKSTVDFNADWANPVYQTGKLASRSGTNCFMTPESEEDGAVDLRQYDFSWQTLRCFTIRDANTVLVTLVVNSEGKVERATVATAGLSELKTAREAGEGDADYGVLRLNRLSPKSLIIYRVLRSTR